jgi:hypothetical protein
MVIPFTLATKNSDLSPGRSLNPGGMLNSPTGAFVLVFQNDSNLVLYHIEDSTFNWGVPPTGFSEYSFAAHQNFVDSATWDAGTVGSGANLCIMQNDGNLVIYRDNTVPVFASNTSGNPGAFLRVQDDGNVVIYGSGGPIWNTQTNARRP